MCYLPNLKLLTLYYRFLTIGTSPCRRLQLPLMGFLVACQEGDKIQRVLMINTGRKRRPKHPSAASDDLCLHQNDLPGAIAGKSTIKETPHGTTTDIRKLPRGERRTLFPPATLPGSSHMPEGQITCQWCSMVRDKHHKCGIFGTEEESEAVFCIHNETQLYLEGCDRCPCGGWMLLGLEEGSPNGIAQTAEDGGTQPKYYSWPYTTQICHLHPARHVPSEGYGDCISLLLNALYCQQKRKGILV
ncbi:uncharacterized protein LOC115340680 [Aquila chrysaetos chrysaetos]|uniref:uncharacterized protein LOC115340680 n=1 Tax=Aquila chrysaetos chrysaetos TaxID=223781 RepID=UPI0011772AE8|nr:uncharacterized protein LOC115340680 [Aquila chrysaetos chrysaetos]